MHASEKRNQKISNMSPTAGIRFQHTCVSDHILHHNQGPDKGEAMPRGDTFGEKKE